MSVANIPFDGLDAFTLEVWVKGWRGPIVCQGQAGDPENSIWVSLGHRANVGCPHESCGWETGFDLSVGEGDQLPDLSQRKQHGTIVDAQWVSVAPVEEAPSKPTDVPPPPEHMWPGGLLVTVAIAGLAFFFGAIVTGRKRPRRDSPDSDSP